MPPNPGATVEIREEDLVVSVRATCHGAKQVRVATGSVRA